MTDAKDPWSLTKKGLVLWISTGLLAFICFVFGFTAGAEVGVWWTAALIAACASTVGLVMSIIGALPSQKEIEASKTKEMLSKADDLDRLAKLHDSGALTDAEYEAAKRSLV